MIDLRRLVNSDRLWQILLRYSEIAPGAQQRSSWLICYTIDGVAAARWSCADTDPATHTWRVMFTELVVAILRQFLSISVWLVAGRGGGRTSGVCVARPHDTPHTLNADICSRSSDKYLFSRGGLRQPTSQHPTHRPTVSHQSWRPYLPPAIHPNTWWLCSMRVLTHFGQFTWGGDYESVEDPHLEVQHEYYHSRLKIIPNPIVSL